jgi:hypothetical protein
MRLALSGIPSKGDRDDELIPSERYGNTAVKLLSVKRLLFHRRFQGWEFLTSIGFCRLSCVLLT